MAWHSRACLLPPQSGNECHESVEITYPVREGQFSDFNESGYLCEMRSPADIEAQTWVENFLLQKSADVLEANVS